MTASTERELVGRLERVERENTRLKALGLVALAALTSVLLMAQVRPPGRLVAGEFAVQNQDGKVVASLYADQDGLPRFVLYDKQGYSRAHLSITHRDAAGLLLSGPAEAPVPSDPSAPPPPRSSVYLHVAQVGSPSVTLVDGADRERVTVALSRDGRPYIELVNERGEAVWSAP